MATPPPNPIPFGKYTLQRKLAKGGMAELFLAADAAGQPVVIKRVLPTLSSDAEFLRMFLDEARIASQLSHPSIVRVRDLGQESGHLYIAMEFIDGFDLEKLLRTFKGPFPAEVGVRVGASLCGALYYANRMTDLTTGKPLNVVHRDVTPGNVMVTRRGVVKLVDFGIAKATAQLERTKPGIVKGKFRYMSPEQVSQRDLDARSDLFSLGILLYEMTTGEKPFERTQVIDTIRAIAGWDPPPPTDLIPGYPKRLSDVIMKALAKDPAQRFKDAREMQEALEAIAVRLPACGPRELAQFVCDLMQVAPLPPEPEGRRSTEERMSAIGDGRRVTGEQPAAERRHNTGEGELIATAAISEGEVKKMLEEADRRAAVKARSTPPRSMRVNTPGSRQDVPAARPGPPVSRAGDVSEQSTSPERGVPRAVLDRDDEATRGEGSRRERIDDGSSRGEGARRPVDDDDDATRGEGAARPVARASLPTIDLVPGVSREDATCSVVVDSSIQQTYPENSRLIAEYARRARRKFYLAGFLLLCVFAGVAGWLAFEMAQPPSLEELPPPTLPAHAPARGAGR